MTKNTNQSNFLSFLRSELSVNDGQIDELWSAYLTSVLAGAQGTVQEKEAQVLTDQLTGNPVSSLQDMWSRYLAQEGLTSFDAFVSAGGFTTEVVLTGPATVTVQELIEANTASPATVSYTPTADTTGVVFIVGTGYYSNAVPSLTVGGTAAEFLGDGSAIGQEQYSSPVSPFNEGLWAFYAPITTTGARDVVVTIPGIGGTPPIYCAALDIVGLTVRNKRVYSRAAPRPSGDAAIAVANSGLAWSDNDVQIIAMVGDSDPSGTEVATFNVEFGATLGAVQKTDALTGATSQTVTSTSRGFRTRFSHLLLLLGSSNDVVIREGARPTDWVFQRTFGGSSGSVPVSGTYDGSPSGIQCRVLDWSDDSEVVTWTTIDASPTGGTFSGNITVAQGGPYYFEFREVGGTEVFGTKCRFGVGAVGAIYGQSNAGFMGSNPTSAAHMTEGYTDLSMRIKDGGLRAPTGAGEATFAKAVFDYAGIPVMFSNNGISGQDIDSLSKGDASGYYDDLIADLQRIAPQGIEFVLWVQGEQDAVGGNPDYAATLETLRTDIETDLGQSANTLKIYCASLAHANVADGSWDAINDEIKEAASTYSNIIFSHAAVDFTRTDDYHYSTASYAQAGRRFARSLALETGAVTGSHQFEIASAAITSATTTTITLTHGLGTDFTPTTGIVGFEVSNDGFSTPVTPSAAVRTNATTITLTHSDIGTGSRQVRYLSGADPAGVGASGTPANIVIDNGALSMPLSQVTTLTAT